MPHQLRSPPADFTGRAAELAELRAKLDTGGVIIAGLTGQGGVGKTALALVLAQSLLEQYPDGQIDVNLRGTSHEPYSSSEVMAEVIHAFEPDARLPDDQEARARLYRTTLYGRRVLLLLDNARDRAQVEPLVPPRGCLLLVTSRQHFVLPGISSRRLGNLGPDEATEFIRSMALTVDQAHAAELAKVCGYLPLALRVAARVLAERANLSAARYVERIRASQERFSEVDAVLNESLELLDEPTRTLFIQISVFLADFDATAGAAVAQVDPEITESILGSLIQWSLVEYNQTTGRYSLHDIVRNHVQSRLGAAERYAAERRHAEYFVNFAHAANNKYTRGGLSLLEGIALFDRDWKNISVAQAWATRNMDHDEAAAFACNALLSATANYASQLQRRPPHEQIRWGEAALAAAQRTRQDLHVVASLVQLGGAHIALGNWHKASSFYRRALAMSRQAGDLRNEGVILSNLGHTRLRFGKPKEAAVLCCRSLQIAHKINNHIDESNALGNLGIAYAALGDDTNAISCCERALSIAQQIGDHVCESIAGSNLANMYERLDELSKAIELRSTTVAVLRKLGHRRSEAEELANLATLYRDQGAVREAFECLQQCLRVAREAGHRSVEARALVNLATSRLEAGELHEFFEYGMQALDIASEVGDRTTEILLVGNVGIAYGLQEKWPEAADAFVRALALVAQAGKIDRRTEVELFWNLGYAYEKQGELSKAVSCFEIVVKSACEVGVIALQMLATRALGLAYERLGDLRGAIDAMQVWVAFATDVCHPYADADAAHLNEVRVRLAAQSNEMA
ncbi:tetratricopeptide repeat protein [Sorangium sp. So ce448]|uniref:tetratricopeptide repeat protein n=1 Tax=Sorangium sp. So ce448 TaxID=3133314 RepID=UPI003F635683